MESALEQLRAITGRDDASALTLTPSAMDQTDRANAIRQLEVVSIRICGLIVAAQVLVP